MIPVYVLVGGKSSRFGSDKASYLLEGVPWALHVGKRLAAGAPITLVGESPDAGPLIGERFIADVDPPVGVQSGVLAALRDRREHLGEGLLILASCDLVYPDPAWLAPLLQLHADHPQLEVAAYQAADRWQPFPCVAHTRWTEQLTQQLSASDHSLQATFHASQAAAIPWTQSTDGPPQANQPEQLQQLLDAKKQG